ncbi:MAG: caspase family protein [Rhodocyclaceae bacterium]|nr:caspase family protein [Rhodocyclaceae bacterium]
MYAKFDLPTLLGMVFGLVLAVVFAAGAGAAETSAPDMSRKALVIGNSAYRALPRLGNPVNDARDVCAALQRLGFEATCLFDVPSKREMRDAVRAFAASLDARSAGFFFFAGHGIQVRGENYLMPTDAEIATPPDVDYEGFELDYVLRSVAGARNAPNIIVLDACRDNPFQRADPSAWVSGLARVDPPVGTVLVYATAPDGSAIDGDQRNGLFTKHLLAQIEAQGLTLDEMLRRVAQGVEAEARQAYGARQIPYRSSSYSGQFCFAGCTDPELDARLREISAQKERLARELEAISSENRQLRSEASRGAQAIRELESRVEQLSSQASESGSRRKDVEDRLAEAREALQAARDSQSERARLEAENQAKTAALSRLQATLQQQSDQLEAYRAEIQRLTQERATRASQSRSAPAPKSDSKSESFIMPTF